MGIFAGKLNSKFFYKVFGIITSIILVCSISISLLLYYRFNLTMTKANKNFISYTSSQIKSNITNLLKKNELIAGNIYSNSSIELFLKANYYQVVDYSLLETFNFISSYFQGIEANNADISGICIFKLYPGLITDGRNVRDVSEFNRQDLIKKAVDARGNNVWASYTGEDGSLRFCLLKYLNLYKPGGILAIELKEESFFNLYKAFAGNNGLFIIDTDNHIISSSQRDTLGKNFNTVLGGYLPGSGGAAEVRFNNITYFVNQDKINDAWSIVTLFNTNEMERERVKMALFVLALAGVFILAGLMFSLFLASGFAAQVDRLMAKIREIERGNLKLKPDIKRVNEFYQLDKTLCAMAESIDRLNSDIMRAVRQKEENEIKYLQMQMNPHFLYNLLSAIRWIAYGNRQEKIIEIVDNLSNFYKIALSKGNDIIEIESEISLVKSYIELQNLCFDNSIRLEIHLDERLMGLKISKMTLQPFVENSVLHGRSGDRILNVSINILLEKSGSVVFRIEDDGVGITDDMVQNIERLNEKGIVPESKHYGIMNTVARLSLLYGDSVRIHAARRDPGTIMELSLKPV